MSYIIQPRCHSPQWHSLVHTVPSALMHQSITLALTTSTCNMCHANVHTCKYMMHAVLEMHGPGAVVKWKLRRKAYLTTQWHSPPWHVLSYLGYSTTMLLWSTSVGLTPLNSVSWPHRHWPRQCATVLWLHILHCVSKKRLNFKTV